MNFNLFRIDDECDIFDIIIMPFSPSALRWFDSYLEGRHQAVLSETGLTEFAKMRYGVPQGSILGPALFLFS